MKHYTKSTELEGCTLELGDTVLLRRYFDYEKKPEETSEAIVRVSHIFFGAVLYGLRFETECFIHENVLKEFKRLLEIKFTTLEQLTEQTLVLLRVIEEPDRLAETSEILFID